ncbi:hypothetical protein [Anaerovorax odorimutans]|uniref:hypothetical protein n=1 Tax=Anaerovorax odorimutans TaxID=109327 RepID=UPI00040FA702|nr:hypothetical protein [Anaerovorax odorimutans]
MIKKRNQFWTMIFAFVPGAGHMYNGFMKLGVSFMGLFFGFWAITLLLKIGTIGLLTPVIWFYAFFDCINRTFLDDEDFYSQEDDYLFNILSNDKDLEYIKSKKYIIGVILVFIGLFALWNNVFMGTIIKLINLPDIILNMIYTINHIVVQIIVAILIIWAGVILIKGKKE